VIDANARLVWGDDTFLREVERRSGTSVSACYQCHKCSTGCPVGVEREVLESEAIWLCASCEACTARCPMGIDVAAVMDTLRMLAVERGVQIPNKRSAAFGKAFLNSVSRFGRVFELGTVIDYKLRTRDLFSDIDKALSMVARRKLSPLPKRSGGVTAAREVMERTEVEEKKR
jgi:heterodisulfide reductase subunit C